MTVLGVSERCSTRLEPLERRLDRGAAIDLAHILLFGLELGQRAFETGLFPVAMEGDQTARQRNLMDRTERGLGAQRGFERIGIELDLIPFTALDEEFDRERKEENNIVEWHARGDQRLGLGERRRSLGVVIGRVAEHGEHQATEITHQPDFAGAIKGFTDEEKRTRAAAFGLQQVKRFGALHLIKKRGASNVFSTL